MKRTLTDLGTLASMSDQNGKDDGTRTPSPPSHGTSHTHHQTKKLRMDHGVKPKLLLKKSFQIRANLLSDLKNVEVPVVYISTTPCGYYDRVEVQIYDDPTNWGQARPNSNSRYVDPTSNTIVWHGKASFHMSVSSLRIISIRKFSHACRQRWQSIFRPWTLTRSLAWNPWIPTRRLRKGKRKRKKNSPSPDSFHVDLENLLLL